MRALMLAAALGASCGSPSAIADVLPLQGTWTTTLQGRDFNGDGVADAFYDTSLNVTWLANAAYRGELTYPDSLYTPFSPTTGEMEEGGGRQWVASLDIAGISGWRLPTGVVPSACTWDAHDGSFPTVQPGEPCLVPTTDTSSEITHMFLVTLGDAQGKPFNTGPFTGLSANATYAVSSFYFLPGGNPNSYAALRFLPPGLMIGSIEQDQFSVPWAVHDGDVAAIPEPSTYALILGGLFAIAVATRRRRT